MKFVLALVALLVGVFLVAGCLGPSPDTIKVVADQLTKFSNTLSTALADGIVTPDEGALIQSTFQELGGKITVAMTQASSIDWGQALGIAGSSVLAALTGVKIIPGSLLQGPFDRQKTTP